MLSVDIFSALSIWPAQIIERPDGEPIKVYLDPDSDQFSLHPVINSSLNEFLSDLNSVFRCKTPYNEARQIDETFYIKEYALPSIDSNELDKLNLDIYTTDKPSPMAQQIIASLDPYLRPKIFLELSKDAQKEIISCSSLLYAVNSYIPATATRGYQLQIEQIGQKHYASVKVNSRRYERWSARSAVKAKHVAVFHFLLEHDPEMLKIYNERNHERLARFLEPELLSKIQNLFNSGQNKIKMSHYDLIVIGCGSGGLGAAKRAKALGNKVAIIEAGRLGGTCVNVGCIPKKLMYEAATFREDLDHADAFGFTINDFSFDWAKLKAKRDAHIVKINNRYVESLSSLDIPIINGWARFTGNKELIVNEETTYTADHIIIATGSQALMPENTPGTEHCIDSDGFFELEQMPESAIIIGNGYIAAELTGVLNTLGCKCIAAIRTQIYCGRDFEKECTEYVADYIVKHGVDLRKGYTAANITEENGIKTVEFQNGEKLSAQIVLMAIGRGPKIGGLGLENTEIQFDRTHIIVDEFQNTTVPGVYAIGDVSGNAQLTPVATKTGKILAERVFNGAEGAKMNYDLIPSVMFTHPPVGRCGMTHDQAIEQYTEDGIRVIVDMTMDLHFSMRQDEQKVPTMCKLIIRKSDGLILGFHCAGRGADEMTQGFAVAMKMGAKKTDFDATVAIHPTVSEQFVLLP